MAIKKGKFAEPKPDKKLVSNQWHEIYYLAKKYGIKAWVIYRMKDVLADHNGKTDKALLIAEIEKAIDNQQISWDMWFDEKKQIRALKLLSDADSGDSK